MSSIIKKIKNLVPLEFKIKCKSMRNLDEKKKWASYKDCSKKRIFIFIAGFYQNLGDMAITYAQREFLKDVYPDAEIIWVPDGVTFEAVDEIKKYIRPDDLITLIGGGNMSDTYYHLETCRRYVVKNFPNNKIISFPQTMFFSDSKNGQKELAKSRKVYEGHKNFVMFAREMNAYERMKKGFPNVDVRLAPDIVLYLNKYIENTNRHGVVCCLRMDKERNISSSVRDGIIASLKEKFGDVIVTDTTEVAKEDCTSERIDTTLESFWDIIRGAKVVVTDRLHCMIFCVITGTPCVALDNSNKKISGVYDKWLKEIPFVAMLSQSDIEGISAKVNDLFSQNNSIFEYNGLVEKFDQLRNSVIKN